MHTAGNRHACRAGHRGLSQWFDTETRRQQDQGEIMNKTNKRLAVLTIMGSVALAACGSKTDSNERNFSATLDKYLEKEGD